MSIRKIIYELNGIGHNGVSIATFKIPVDIVRFFVLFEAREAGVTVFGD
jgi:hypothetical protein